MALRVLTADERQALQGDSHFLELAQWSARDYASYWASNDGSGAATEAQRIKWVKDRMLSVGIELNDIGDSQIALKYVKLSKGMQLDLAPAPVPTEDIINALLAGNKFEELASLYFSLQGEFINFSVGG